MSNLIINIFNQDVERWGFELDDRLIRKPYRGKINAAVCRALDIADDCLEIAINGGNIQHFNIDFDKVDKDTLFDCLHRLDYELTQDANDGNKLIVSW